MTADPLRVAMIAGYPWDPEVVPGGVTAVGLATTQALAGVPGLDLHVVCCQPGVPRDLTVERDGATIHFLHHNHRLSQLTAMRPQRRRIAAVLRELRPALVHAQGLGLPAAAALEAPLPHLITVHGIIWREPIEAPSPITRLGDLLRHRQARRQAARARNLVLTSGYVATVLPPAPDRRTFTIPNPVDADLFHLENRPTAPHVLVVGGLRRRKDPMTSVRVMERVLARLPDATMHLLGLPSGTALDRRVAARLRERGLERSVRLLGLVPREVLHREYRRASVLLMPSLEETAPVALSEACAVGLPQVGSDAGGIPYLIGDGETGYVRPVGDDEGMAERVLAILTDEGLRTRLAAGARERGRREFAGEVVARRTMAAYGEILGRQPDAGDVPGTDA